MASLALYRKYRPQSFATVVGQETIKNTLISMNLDGHINHGFIFSGPKGTGKTTIAKIFAKAINCLNQIHGDACNECDNCKNINDNSAIDILELDAASNNGVDEIRSIVDNVMYLPISLKYKVYIIDEAHMLTTGAWNALLKTLEEPPQHAVFILATTEYNKIPATIISRCQRYDFHRLTVEQLNQLVLNVCKKENIEIDPQSSKEIAMMADGAGRDALSILSQLAVYTNNNINIDAINKVFNITNQHELVKLINLLSVNKMNEIIQMLREFDNNGINWTIFTTNLMNICMDKYLLSINVQDNLLVNNIDLIKQVEMNSSDCLKFANILSQTLINLKTSINAYSTFELACLNFVNNQVKSDDYSKITKIDNNISCLKSGANKTNLKQTDDVVQQVKTTIKNVPIIDLETPSIDNLFTTITRNDLSNVPENTNNKTITIDQNLTQLNIDLSISNPYDILKQEPTTKINERYNQITQDAFNYIVNNNNKQLTLNEQHLLDDYLAKNEFDLSSYTCILKEISKIWVSTNEATILAFPSTDAVNDFSELLNDVKFIKILSEIFGDNKVLFAIDNIMRDNMKEAYLKAKENKTIPHSFDTTNFVTTNNEKISLQEKIKKLLD